jgi:glucokinase
MFVGVDLGGTHLRTALVDAAGSLRHLRKVPTDIASGAKTTALRLISECQTQVRMAREAGERVLAVGLGVAGKVDRNQGKVIFSPNLLALNGYPLARELQHALEIPVILENDANLFGVGENWVGAGRGLSNWVGVTLGTGVGGCLIFDGRLWTGDDLGFAGEIGHMVITPDGPPCVCGLRGCLEAHASGRALMEGIAAAVASGSLISGRLHDLWQSGWLTPAAVYESALAGDPLARGLFRQLGWALGLALAGVFSVLGIGHAVVGGGVSAAWDQFIEPLQASLAAHSSMLDRKDAVVLRGQLGDHAALLGAARLAALEASTPS